MQRSTERILTTHVGSLPRPPDLLEMINAKEEGRLFDLSRYGARVKSAALPQSLRRRSRSQRCAIRAEQTGLCRGLRRVAGAMSMPVD